MCIRLSLLFVSLFLVSAAVAQKPVKKKNTRPVEAEKVETTRAPGPPVYFYEFSRPEFIISKVRIEHDEAGLGTITFSKKRLEEEIVLPIELSAATVDLLNTYWTNLDFLNSDEEYQSKRDYAHLGTRKLKMKLDGRERLAAFNWTENPDAHALADEYRKIGYQYVWMFDIDVARRNQPLESPRIMKELAIYLRMGNISDPPNMVPFLRELGNDERIPLIARNQAKRIAESIEKKVSGKK